MDLETIGKTPKQRKTLTAADSKVLQEFGVSYHIEHGHRFVRLPKKNMCDLSLKHYTAEGMFRTLHKQLQQVDALQIIHEEPMLDHVKKEQVELARYTENSFGLIYLPRHAVKKKALGIISGE